MAIYNDVHKAIAAIRRAGEVKVVGNGSASGKVGQIIKVTKSTNVSIYADGQNNKVQIANTYYLLTDLDIKGRSKLELEQEVKDLERQIIDTKARIAFIEESGSEEFDDTEFKVWHILQELKKGSKGKKNEFETAKAIAAIVNN